MISPLTSRNSKALGPLLHTLGLCASALTVTLLSCASYAAWLPTLSDQDKQSISTASMQRAQVTTRSKTNANDAHPLGLQILFIEAQESKKKSPSASLLAEVFLFDYQRVQASMEIVDVESGKLIDTKTLASLHLPLNATETNYVTELLRTDTLFFDGLSTEYQRQFGTAVDNSKAIDMKVSIWVPTVNVLPKSNCLASRCALVSVFTEDHYNFSTEPVVDLVSGEIFLDLVQ